ncbi:MAG: 1,4-dihydroxy-2-naphthoate octaprenyltransferase [Segetibacter sp.]|nr:1,4-dihydroxy-2-naphthoate octaprenyltransferase [Segetibacter sp.]
MPAIAENNLSIFSTKTCYLLHRSTIQLLRFPFSYFLMPVFWFALIFPPEINWLNAAIIFVILHLLVYPSSNGYNSFMDRDEDSIGGIEKPMQPTVQLFYASIVMDVSAVLLSLVISTLFATGILVYIISSRLYSYRKIRLKQYPILGYLIVILNQGALVFFLVYTGVSPADVKTIPWQGVVTAAFLIGGFYPITQVYQHNSDAKDGVNTISMVLGKRGTFVFCAAMYSIALGILFSYFISIQQQKLFWILQLFFIPVLVFFLLWMKKVWRNSSEANFINTMKMNWLASTCTALAFISIIIVQQIG